MSNVKPLLSHGRSHGPRRREHKAKANKSENNGAGLER